GELAGVTKKIEHALPDLSRVGPYAAEIAGTVDCQGIGVLLDQRSDAGHDVLHHGRDGEGLQGKLHLASLNVRKVEDVVDERPQVLPRGANFLEVGDEVRLPQIFRLLLQHL